MMRGRKPKPTALKVITGNPGKRKLNDREPHPPLGATPPPGMSLPALSAWEVYAPQLREIGLLTRLDAPALMLLCDAYVTYCDAREKVDNSGPVIRSPKGYPIQNPYLAIKNRAQEQMLKVLAEFGMTPASRSRIAAGEGGEGDADEWLSLKAGT